MLFPRNPWSVEETHGMKAGDQFQKCKPGRRSWHFDSIFTFLAQGGIIAASGKSLSANAFRIIFPSTTLWTGRQSRRLRFHTCQNIYFGILTFPFSKWGNFGRLRTSVWPIFNGCTVGSQTKLAAHSGNTWQRVSKTTSLDSVRLLLIKHSYHANSWACREESSDQVRAVGSN